MPMLPSTNRMCRQRLVVQIAVEHAGDAGGGAPATGLPDGLGADVDTQRRYPHRRQRGDQPAGPQPTSRVGAVAAGQQPGIAGAAAHRTIAPAECRIGVPSAVRIDQPEYRRPRCPRGGRGRSSGGPVSRPSAAGHAAVPAREVSADGGREPPCRGMRRPPPGRRRHYPRRAASDRRHPQAERRAAPAVSRRRSSGRGHRDAGERVARGRDRAAPAPTSRRRAPVPRTASASVSPAAIPARSAPVSCGVSIPISSDATPGTAVSAERVREALVQRAAALRDHPPACRSRTSRVAVGSPASTSVCRTAGNAAADGQRVGQCRSRDGRGLARCTRWAQPCLHPARHWRLRDHQQLPQVGGSSGQHRGHVGDRCAACRGPYR